MLFPSLTRSPHADPHRRPELPRQLHEARRGARVQAEPVHDRGLRPPHSGTSVCVRAARRRRAADPTPRGSPRGRRSHNSRASVRRSPWSRRPGQLDQHRQIHARHDLDATVFEKGQAEVRRRSAEHVGQDQHGTSPPSRTRSIARANRVARQRHVVVPADRHGDEARQIADDHFGGVEQLGGQLPVRDHHDTNRRARSSHLHVPLRPGGARESRMPLVVRSRFANASAMATDRWRPPVQPIAIVRYALPSATYCGTGNRSRSIVSFTKRIAGRDRRT